MRSRSSPLAANFASPVLPRETAALWVPPRRPRLNRGVARVDRQPNETEKAAARQKAAARARAWRAAHPDEAKAREKAYRAANAAKISAQKAAYYAREPGKDTCRH